MGKLLMKATVAAALITGVTAPIASAYDVPGVPGTPGGPPTAATGGTGPSKGATGTTATSIAGYTPLELALRTPTPRLFFPSAGTMKCNLAAGTVGLGTGTATRSSRGSATLNVYLSNFGRTYLYNHNGAAISITVKCEFVPRNGKKSTSSATVVTDA